MPMRADQLAVTGGPLSPLPATTVNGNVADAGTEPPPADTLMVMSQPPLMADAGIVQAAVISEANPGKVRGTIVKTAVLLHVVESLVGMVALPGPNTCRAIELIPLGCEAITSAVILWPPTTKEGAISSKLIVGGRPDEDSVSTGQPASVVIDANANRTIADRRRILRGRDRFTCSSLDRPAEIVARARSAQKERNLTSPPAVASANCVVNWSLPRP